MIWWLLDLAVHKLSDSKLDWTFQKDGVHFEEIVCEWFNDSSDQSFANDSIIQYFLD